MITTNPLDDILGKLQGVKPNSAGWSAKCPAHDDRNASLSIREGDDGRVLMKCHAGCENAAIVGKLGMQMRDLFARKDDHHRHNGNGQARQIVAVYSYTDREGVELFQCVRFQPKDFRQRRSDGNGGWVWSLEGVETVLYRLSEVMEADPSQWLFICEGEKDVDRCYEMGLVATCNPMGAGKWKGERGDRYSESCRARRCCIIADKDEPGRKHAQDVAASLVGKARDVRIIEVPTGKDAFDHFDAGGTAADLVKLAEAAKPAKDIDAGIADEPPKPTSVDVEDNLHARASHRTDVGNAARFVVKHGQDLRYCKKLGEWLCWTGKRWELDESGLVGRLAQRTVLGIFDEARDAQDDDARAKIAGWAVKSQKRERISAMVKLAEPHLSISTDELDADPWLLNCGNGSVDLRTGNLRPHRREDYCTKICRADYDIDADCLTFGAFLNRIFKTHPNLIPWLQKVFGYSLTGTTREQVLFFLHGGGSNGKTTLLDIALKVMGDYGGKADRDLLAAKDGQSHPTNIADLKGRRTVVCSETNEGGRFDEAKLKDIVGETVMKARYMRCNFFEFNATHKVFIYSNHRPLVRGTDLGFWRRMRLIPFVEVIGDAEKDQELPAKLEAERDGILAWMVIGCLRWQQEGLGMPEEVKDATNNYRNEMDSIGAFLDERCDFGTDGEAGSRELYRSYLNWCEANGEKPLSQKRLGMQLRERGLTVERDKTGRKTWCGIALREQENDSVGAVSSQSFGGM